MKSITNHYHAITATFTALFNGKFLIYFVPGLVVTCIYWYFKHSAQVYEDSIDISTGNSWIDWATGWVDTGISGLFSLFDAIFEQIYIFIIITVLSPFNTSLGEKFDHSLTGNKFDSNIIRFINDFIRMIFVVIIAIFLEIVFISVYWVVSWMFGLDFLDPYMYHILAAFFFGFSFYDFSLERYEEGVFSSLYYAFANPLSMIITGSIFLVIYKIPYLGIPIAPVLAVMISGVVYLYSTKRLPKQTEISKTLDNE